MVGQNSDVKGCNCIANLQKKMTLYNPNVDLVRGFTTLYINFSDVQGQITGVGGGIWPKFELIQAFMHVLLSCKNEVDKIKNEGARVFARFLPF